MDVLVTGASGFIGANLCHRLVADGHAVHGLDRRPPADPLPDAVTFHERDLTDRPRLPPVDRILHLAAHSQVQPIVESPAYAVENVAMTEHVLAEAKRVDAGVVHASSRDVYGRAIKPDVDDVTAESPNGYAASKLGAEAIANAYHATEGVPVTSLRLANVYGPRDRNQRVIPIFVALADAGEELTVYGDGKVLDFVHVDDVCRALTAAMERLPAVAGDALNVGSGTGTRLTAVADRIASEVDACPGWTATANRTGDVARYVAETDRAAALLDFTADVALDDGLPATVDWYRDHPDLLADVRANLDA